METTSEDKKANKKLEKEIEKAKKKEEKDAEKARLKAEKAKLKAEQPPKKRGRPPKEKPVVDKELSVDETVIDMKPYSKIDMLYKFAEDVCTSLGPGHLESIYHAAMAVELRIAGLPYESEQVIPVTHKGHFVGIVRADIIVDKECVLEFKISGKLDDAKQQARQYMKLQGIEYGFVVMFPKTDGGKIQFVDARVPDVAELNM